MSLLLWMRSMISTSVGLRWSLLQKMSCDLGHLVGRERQRPRAVDLGVRRCRREDAFDGDVAFLQNGDHLHILGIAGRGERGQRLGVDGLCHLIVQDAFHGLSVDRLGGRDEVALAHLNTTHVPDVAGTEDRELRSRLPNKRTAFVHQAVTMFTRGPTSTRRSVGFACRRKECLPNPSWL